MIDIKKLTKKFDAFFNKTDRRTFMSIVRKNRQAENNKNAPLHDEAPNTYTGSERDEPY